MEPVDHNIIGYSYYSATAIEVRPILTDILQIRTSQKPSFLQALRLTEGKTEPDIHSGHL